MKRVTLYTDGACSGNPGVGGYGCVLMYNGHEKRPSGAGGDTTNKRLGGPGGITGLSCLEGPSGGEGYNGSAQ